MTLALLIWILLMVACFAAVAYAIWWWVEQRERHAKAQRGFEVKLTAQPVSKEVEKERD